MKHQTLLARLFFSVLFSVACSAAVVDQTNQTCDGLTQVVGDVLTSGRANDDTCTLLAEEYLSCSPSVPREPVRASILTKTGGVDYSQIPDLCKVMFGYIVSDNADQMPLQEVAKNVSFLEGLSDVCSDDELTYLLAVNCSHFGDYKRAAGLFEVYFASYLGRQGYPLSVSRIRPYIINCIKVEDFCTAGNLCKRIAKTDPEINSVSSMCMHASEACE